MADKTVIFAVGKKKLDVLNVTSVDIEEKLDSDVEPTFSGPVTKPSNDGGYTIDISLLAVRTLKQYQTLKQLLKLMKTSKGEISVYETVKHKTTTFEVENHFTGVTLTSNKVKYDAEDLTAGDLSFNAETMREIVGGTEI